MIDKAQKLRLKSEAHHLKPVVMLGDKGLTEAVLAEVEIALAHHGLIKIKISGQDRDKRVQLAEQICQQMKADLVQGMGQMFTLFRRKTD